MWIFRCSELPDIKTFVDTSGDKESLYTDVPLIAKKKDFFV